MAILSPLSPFPLTIRSLVSATPRATFFFTIYRVRDVPLVMYPQYPCHLSRQAKRKAIYPDQPSCTLASSASATLPSSPLTLKALPSTMPSAKSLASAPMTPSVYLASIRNTSTKMSLALATPRNATQSFSSVRCLLDRGHIRPMKQASSP